MYGFVFFFQLALLCGAPGLGKTTLAHIIAHHAGYHVVEINARLAMLFGCIRHTYILCASICLQEGS